MKAKLLKKLRKEFFVEYYYSMDMYKFNTPYDCFYIKDRNKAIDTCRFQILTHAELNYSKYAKKIRL